MYGKELILDLHDCDPSTFTRKSLKQFFIRLCAILHMQRCDLHFWDYKGFPEEYEKAEDHLKGTSAIQFISTSNITIHTLDVLKKVFINIFSCKDFNQLSVKEFAEFYFNGKVIKETMVERA